MRRALLPPDLAVHSGALHATAVLNGHLIRPEGEVVLLVGGATYSSSSAEAVKIRLRGRPAGGLEIDEERAYDFEVDSTWTNSGWCRGMSTSCWYLRRICRRTAVSRRTQSASNRERRSRSRGTFGQERGSYRRPAPARRPACGRAHRRRHEARAGGPQARGRRRALRIR